MTPELLRVMYAPLDYIHPERFAKPANALPAAVEEAINHTLIQRFALETALSFPLQTGDFSQRLVSEWKNIRRAAWLLGCKLGRGSLARTGQLATLPNMARRFIELPIACPACPLPAPISQSSLELHGAGYLQLLQQQLPRALAQRLVLLFESDQPVDLNVASLNRPLLNFAFDYAKNPIH
ncbi:type III secretion system OrgA/MxiK family protein [Oxalobacteraceae bacterium GrIS 2.11]